MPSETRTSIAAMKILITGASGFIGSHMVEQALQLGHKVWAAVRPTSNRKYLTDERIHFIELDYTDGKVLQGQLQDFTREYGCWDVIIHCAGATRCLRHSDFYTINYEGTRLLVDMLMALDIVPRQFIFMSSLGTYGPIHEKQPYQPIRDVDTPSPNTHYGRSKRKTEEYLMSLPAFPYLIFRPTGVYGPRDKDYQILVNGIRHHTELALGFRRQEITFVYVKDLVQAVFLAIAKGVTHRAYFVTDGNVYTSHDFGHIVREELGRPFVLRLTLPLWAGRVAALLCDGIARLTHCRLTLNSDKYRILSQRNWTCDIKPLIEELGYSPQYDLQRGVAETIQDYASGSISSARRARRRVSSLPM